MARYLLGIEICPSLEGSSVHGSSPLHCHDVVIRMALSRNSRLRHACPLSRQDQGMQTISAVKRAEKRFMRAMPIWISAVLQSESLALMRAPKALRHRIFASPFDCPLHR